MANSNFGKPERATRSYPGLRWRNVVLIGAVLTQTACAATMVTAPATTVAGDVGSAYSAADAAAKLRIQEEYQRTYPNVDVTDDYALAKALLEDIRRSDPDLLGGKPFPERLIWEANSNEPSVKTILAARQASIAAAEAALPRTAPVRVAKDQAWLRQADMPWVAVSEAGPYDVLNLASVAPYACAIRTMQFSVNWGATETQEFTSCENGDASAAPPSWTFDLNSIETVSVTITFTDGTWLTRSYSRSEVFWR